MQVDEHKDESEIDNDYKYMFNSFMLFSLVFSCSLIRWFYSEKGKRQGYFWYFEARGFVLIRDTLECYQVMYFLLVTFPFVALNVYFLYPSKPEEWNRYMLEAVGLCALDLIVYIIAFCELANSRRKIGETSRQYGESSNLPERMPDKEDSVIIGKSGLLDNTVLDDKDLLKSGNKT